jgi:penicillin-binding protein 1A
VGSLIKPFVYLAAYENGMLPDTWVDDTPLNSGEVAGGAAGWPANADGKYSRNMRTAEALIRSRNAATVRVGAYAGIETVLETARSAGLLKEANRDPTVFLGNAPGSPWELATAYTTFPNQGSRVIPHLIDKIQNSEGEILYETRPLKQIVSKPETAGLINNLLREVTQSGTAASLRRTHGFTQPAAGKTGTTSDYKDAWYAGYTSSLTGCVWVGLDQPQTIIEGGYGGSLALPIWARIFKKASALRDGGGQARYPAKELDPDLIYQRVTLCRDSAKRITQGCQHAGTAYQDLVPEKLVPAANDFCTVHPMRAMPAPSDNRNTRPRRQPRQSQQTRPAPQRALPVPEESERPQRALPAPQ